MRSICRSNPAGLTAQCSAAPRPTPSRRMPPPGRKRFGSSWFGPSATIVQFDRVSAGERELAHVSVARPVTSADAVDRHGLTDGLREVGAAQADVPEPGWWIALEFPGLRRTIRGRGVDEDDDVRVHPVHLGQ